MTETASKELCAELYKLTGWETDELDWWAYHEGRERMEVVAAGWGNSKEFYPAYSCGYLLRKLPRTLQDKRGVDHFLIIANGNAAETNWCADYIAWGLGNDNSWYVRQVLHIEPKRTDGDTPEDALCKLALELVKQGIVSKGDV